MTDDPASPSSAGATPGKLPGKGPVARSAPLSDVAAGRDPGRASGAASVEHDDAHGMVLGVIVPCRDAAASLTRLMRSLSRSRWPFTPRPHQIVIVDDGSRDDTPAVAAALCAELFGKPSGSTRMSAPLITTTTPAGARVVANARSPGRAGAIRTGIETLGSSVDLLVLLDVDAVPRPNSLLMIEAEFRRVPELGLACGRQELVRDLLDDGSCRGADGKDPVAVADAYDLWSARLRRRESARGRLIAVHGQLLAWRERLGLCPTAGTPAEDLDLMFQVRDKGLRVEMLSGAAFLEVKPPPGAAREAWELCRTRAFLAALADRRSSSRAPSADRWQLAAYKRLPLLAAPSTHVAVAVLLLAAGAGLGALFDRGASYEGALAGAGVGAVVLAGLMISPLGRGTRALMSHWPAIRAARQS